MTFTNFIKRPVLSTVISILIVILGLIGLLTLPIEQYPDVAPPTVSVRTTYTGADAETVKNSVLAPLEESINGVENMDYMESTASNDGSASITIYFRQGVNADMCAVNVQNRISQAQSQLPAEVTRVGVTVNKRQSSQVIMYALVSPDGRYDDQFITNYNEINVVPALKRIAGVGDVMSPGMKTYSMRIWLKPDKMKQYGLMPSDISTALSEQNIEAAPGSFGQESKMAFEYVMRYTGRLKTAEEFKNIILTSDLTGQTLKLKDVADVELGGLSYTVSMRNNNMPSVMGMVQQIAGSNANEIATAVKAELEEQAKSFPPGLTYDVNYDVTDFLYASIHEVVFTLVFTLVLVFLVVYLFLQDFRSTLIPLIAVPVSLIGTFLFLNLFGFSVNLLTLSALLLAIAIVVDDAIVVVEAVHAKLDLGYKSALTASIDAMNEISGAIISITLVMASVFIPVSFMGGVSGTFYREFGITMAISIFISALNALTLSPALCAVFMKPKNEDGTERKLSPVDRFHVAFNTAYDKVLGKYKTGVERFVRKPILTAVCVVLGIAALVVTMSTTRSGLVPDEDTGVVFCTITMPPGTSVHRTQQVIDQVDAMLASNPAVQSRQQIQGYNFISGSGSDQATFIIKLKSFDERNDAQSAQAVLGMIYAQTASIKDAQILAFAPPMIPGFSANNGVSVVMLDRTGGDVNKFFGIVQQYLGELNKRPEIQMAMTSYNSSYPQYMIDVDVAKCKQAGISPSTVLTTLQGYYGGLYASNFNAYGKLYRVMIQGTPESRQRPEDLNNIYVRTTNGMAPVNEFCTMNRVYGPSNINRYNMYTSISVTATVADGYSSGEAIKAVEEVASNMLPAGYGYEFTGLTRTEANSSSSTGLIFILCALERRHTGMAIRWSAILGAGARLRPILMTSLAMIVGLLPMMFASGVGKNGNQTLGAAAVGGMLIGTLCQLFVVPALFMIFQSLQEKLTPLKFDDEENEEVSTELAQYAHRPDDYKKDE